MESDPVPTLAHDAPGIFERFRAALRLSLVLVGAGLTVWACFEVWCSAEQRVPPGRERVVLWHLWGGAERRVVRDVVRRFNAGQDRYWVEEVAVPGQNLDLKFYLSFAGGDFPDLLNQDQQILGPWSRRGILMPLRELASPEEHAQLSHWLFPAARKLGTCDGELYGLCNGLDIRALYYRTEALDGSPPPRTIAELDALALRPLRDPTRIPFLPDDRRLWAWGVAFGGDFFDETTGRVTADDPRIVAALDWMASYTRFHGLETVRAFRSTNREAGAGSLLLEGRYGLMLDGQWRVAEFDAARAAQQARGAKPVFDYGVTPLPHPPGGKERAGWVNGNFFLVPRGCRHPQGAWAFMKFWAGLGHEADAARTAAAGGWIPVSPRVVQQPEFQAFLRAHPAFALFVELAESPNQEPTPAIAMQPHFFERVNRATEEALSLSKSPQAALAEATRDVQALLDSQRQRPH